MFEEKHPLKVFLCHSRGDKVKARELYRTLKDHNIKPWLDVESLEPGALWEEEIPRALDNSDAIIILISKASVEKEGYFQKEIRFSLDRALEMPEGRIFLIPVRVEECDVPRLLSRYHWVDLFEKDGYEKLIISLRARARQLGRMDVKTHNSTNSKAETIGPNTIERAVEYFGPAFLFWGGGFGLYANQIGWQQLLKDAQLQAPFQQVSLIILALLIVIFSTVFIHFIRSAILRLLQGYWPWPFSYYGSGIAALRKSGFEKKIAQLRRLEKAAENGKLDAHQRKMFVNLESWAHWAPVKSDDLLPTELGNILRSRQVSPQRKYGLDWTVCWPRLYSLLPQSVRTDVNNARSTLDHRVDLFFWGLLFWLWTFWTPWAMVISIVWMIIASGIVRQAAMTYGDLLESAFDTNRFLLYDAMGWHRPKSSGEEKELGAQLTEYLWRGTLPNTKTYQSTEDQSTPKS